MNEHLFTNAHGLRLITGFEGKPRLTARLCEGGAWELGYGITFDLNGNPFKEGDTCTPEFADALFRNALAKFEDGVRKLVTVPLNSNQFSALVAFAYNIGLENLATSSVLRRVNENRMDDAAACFGMWVFATKDGHKQALRGLLRRRYAEACLFLSYDWTRACDDDAIALQREIPDTLPGADRVIYKTPFKDVLAVAQLTPLDPPELVLSQPAPPIVAPEVSGSAVGAQPNPAPAASSAPVSPAPSVVQPQAKKPDVVIAPPAAPRPAPSGGPIIYKREAPEAPQAPVKPPEPPPTIQQQRDGVNASNTPGIDPSSPKSMLLSRRFWGLLMVISGRIIFAVWGVDTFLKLGSDPIVSEMVANVMVMLAASAWEYCGEMLHTWGKVRARRPLR